jgi:hypothetical protein
VRYDDGPKTCQHHIRAAKNAIAENTEDFETLEDLVPIRSGWRNWRIMTAVVGELACSVGLQGEACVTHL